MVSYKNGDLFSSGCNVICHQVNCKGMMNAGIAKTMRKKYPDVYKVCNIRSIQIGTRRRMEAGEGDIVCELRIDEGAPFVGFGYSKSLARMAAAELAYDYLDEQGLLRTMEDEIEEPTLERAVSQIQELAQKGYFSFPDYVFNEDHDNNGNPVWTCECHIDEYEDYYYDTASSKKESKRLAAYHMLLSILNHENGRCD